MKVAERIHEDGDPRALALELGVTLQVLLDYQELLDGVWGLSPWKVLPSVSE